MLRVLRCTAHPHPPAPRVVGVDDWALTKGRVYATILVDLERRRPLDLLPDRTAETLAAWLRDQPSIEVSACDRSTEYARGAAQGAPHAQQVADRWHLLVNLREALERWLNRAAARLRSLPVDDHTASLVAQQEATMPHRCVHNRRSNCQFWRSSARRRWSR
jgi:transposase